MKKVAASQILANPYIRGTIEQCCPEFGAAFLGVSDGSALCLVHGFFEPEKGDDRLLIRECFDSTWRISELDRAIANVLALPAVKSSNLAGFILRDAASRGLRLTVLTEAIARGLSIEAFISAVVLGVDCKELHFVLNIMSKDNDWCQIPAINETLRAWCATRPDMIEQPNALR
jgi:hypothetical protein